MLCPDETNSSITHYVPDGNMVENENEYLEVRALCGATCVIDPEGFTIPADFEFVVAPDPWNLTDCWPCLERWARLMKARKNVQKVESWQSLKRKARGRST